jgi:hypothetical protein
MIKPITFKGIPEMTDSARAEMLKLSTLMGAKTKKDFLHALHIELHGRPVNSILNAGDIIRIADKYLIK